MTTWTKLYFIIQMSYWLHNYPELYLQKIRKEDMPSRIVYTSLYLITILYVYLTRFWRISIVLLTIHYLIEIFYHASRLAHFYATIKTGSISAKTISTYLFKTWNIVFVIGRLASVVLAWLTFWFGLKTSSINKITFTTSPITNLNENNTTLNESVIISNFNTPTVRLFTLIATGVLQFWLVWNFIQFHMRRRREQRSARPASIASPKVPNKHKQKQQGLTNGKSENDETIEQPVVSVGSHSNKKTN